jgi:transposase-like protein
MSHMDKLPAPIPRETHVRVCPHCDSPTVKPIGRAVAGSGMIRSDYRCGECSQDFVYVR